MSGRGGGVLVAAWLAWGGTGSAEAAGERTRYTGQVNLNAATAAQLDLLPGVGPKAAERIVAQRQKRPFKRVEELVRVKGFGKKRFLRLKPYLALQGETSFQTQREAAAERAPPRAGP